MSFEMPASGPPPMTLMHPFSLCDVFTDEPFGGNQLAVFSDGQSIPEALLQRLAREINFSETTFLYPARSGDADVRVRIFTPEREWPFAGHPVLGSAFVFAGAMERDEVRLETGAGIVPVTFERRDAYRGHGTMSQPLPRWSAFDRTEDLLRALPGAEPTLPVEHYDNGMRHVFVALPDAERVAALKPDLAQLAERFADTMVSCFARDGAGWKTRVFAPGDGVAEDPATGSAAGALAVHLARHGLTRFGDWVEIRQGAEVGRPSKLRARAVGDAGELRRVEVGGSVVAVGGGAYQLPPPAATAAGDNGQHVHARRSIR
jgi:trans-2,3-dihydro-3-hydroxyanthranilate isomerase